MTSKQTRPHSPAGTRLEGPDGDGVYRIIIPSESRSGKEHTLSVRYDGTLVGCTCEGYAAWLTYRLSAGTAQPYPERRPCWHAVAAGDLLAHHLDPPPADPGGAARARLAPIEGYDDRAAAALDAAHSDPGGAVGEPPEPAGLGACEDAARDTPALDALVERLGNPWLISRGHAGVSLTCVGCRRVRRFHDDGAACWSIAGGWRCGCGGPGPPPPAPGAARKPLRDHLDALYGGS